MSDHPIEPGLSPAQRAARAIPGGTVILDEVLEPDTRIDNEMGDDLRAARLSDDEVQGARLLVVQRTIGRIEGGGGVAIALDACFDRPPGAHIATARLQITLSSPEDATFADIAPAEARDTEAVKFSIKKTATLGIEIEKIKAETGVELATEFNRYYCRVEGSGASTHRAVWTFYENPKTGEGVGHFNRLVLTLNGEGPFEADLSTSCRIIRSGLPGIGDRVRELILGPNFQGRASRQVTFTAPPKPDNWFQALFR